MGARGPRKLDRLIEQVARGERDLASIKDSNLREAVRVALRLHKDAPAGPDTLARWRMRDRVLGSLRPRRPSLADRVVACFELLAIPAPFAVRGIALAALFSAIAAGATVAGADTLPEDPLYSVNLAGEEVRLALAQSAQDRAAVQLSIAEHRLAEVERLAASGRVDDALVASSTYSQEIARAAAELAQLEPAQPEVVALVAQLDDRFNEQRSRMQTLAAKLSADPATALASEILAVVAAPTLAPGLSGPVRVAETAAGVAEDLVRVAEGARAAPVARATTAPRTAEPARATASRASDAKGQSSRVTEAARKAAEQARAAAEKAKAGKSGKGPAKR